MSVVSFVMLIFSWLAVVVSGLMDLSGGFLMVLSRCDVAKRCCVSSLRPLSMMFETISCFIGKGPLSAEVA